MMGCLMQDDRLPARPELSRKLDHPDVGKVPRTRPTPAAPDLDRPGLGKLTPDDGRRENPVHVGLDGRHVCESKLHGHIQAGPEEVNGAAAIEQRGPLVLSGIDGGSRHTWRIG